MRFRRDPDRALPLTHIFLAIVFRLKRPNIIPFSTEKGAKATEEGAFDPVWQCFDKLRNVHDGTLGLDLARGEDRRGYSADVTSANWLTTLPQFDPLRRPSGA
jgi:hypothetical protein